MRLLIQNDGVAPVESFTLLGASTTRDSSVDGVIGQFGTGAKQAVNVLLRAGLDIRVYCGMTCIRFFTKPVTLTDEFGTKTMQRVCAKLSGDRNKTLDLGWVLDFGAIDWNDVSMALREFVSNAIDRTRKAQLSVREAQQEGLLRVALVEDNTMRACSTATRIYVQVNEDVERYFNELPKRFLQFSQDPLRYTKLEPKADRNLSGGTGAVIYREGVYVCELPGTSICDYNFTKDELPIDESRNLNEYVVRSRIAKLYANAEPAALVRVIRAIVDGVKCMEASLDSFYLKDDYTTPVNKAKQKENWQKAWSLVAGDGVLCQNSKLAAEGIIRKGYTPAVLDNSTWFDALVARGVPSQNDVLNLNELKGRVETTPSYAAHKAVQTVWEWIELADMTKGKPCPGVMGFDEVTTDGGASCHGYYTPGRDYVVIRNDLTGALVLTAALEEITHYVSGAGDNSRDFQNFLMNMIVRFMIPAGYTQFCGGPINVGF